MNRFSYAAFVLIAGLGLAATAQDAPPTENSAPPDQPTAGQSKFPELDLQELQRQSSTGSIAVQAVQGTPGGPAIGSVHVKVDLVHRGTVVKSMEGELDQHGVIVFEQIPVNPPVQPVVQVDYADVTYQQVGQLMNMNNTQQKIDVTCYETTAEIPAWKIQMWHVMLSHDKGGIRVNEVAVIQNPAAKTWTGAPSGYDRPVTVAFGLPESASDVQLGKGFHGWCCTTRGTREIASHMPLMPETSELNFSYVIPATDGKAVIDVKAPAEVDHMMIIVPDDIEATQSEDALAQGGTDIIGETRVRYFMGSNIERGKGPKLTLAGLSPRAIATGSVPSTPVNDTGSTAKMIAAIGAGALLLVAVVFFIGRLGTNKQAVQST